LFGALAMLPLEPLVTSGHPQKKRTTIWAVKIRRNIDSGYTVE
jgi:hypothetical protein